MNFTSLGSEGTVIGIWSYDSNDDPVNFHELLKYLHIYLFELQITSGSLFVNSKSKVFYIFVMDFYCVILF